MNKKNPRLAGGFGQVSNEVIRDPNISLKDKGLYAYLASYADSKTNELTVSVNRIASECGTTIATVKRAIKELQELGVIQREYRGKGATRKTVLMK
jgi:predicted transcriptional regulator